MSTAILCAVDVSQPEADRIVLETAARLAAMDGARIDVITVLPDYGLSMVGSFFEEGFHDKAVESSQAALKSFTEDVLGAELSANVRHVVATGTTYEEILNTAKQAASDLIVIGANKPDMKDYLLGPNASRVVRHSKTSVFVVRS